MGYTPLICKDCSTEIFVDVNMVMLKDELWSEISDEHEDSYCDCCIEKRMGRAIETEDFKVPVGWSPVPGWVLCNLMWLEYKKKNS